MDGSSKFVKGDAIAALLVTAINIIGGIFIGVVQRGLPIGQAASKYTILTVGDGLVSQIPSVIMSVAAALLIAKGGVLGSADKALLAQLGGHPGALGVVAVLLAIFAVVPGLPFVPFMLGALALGAFAWRSHQRRREGEAASLRQAEAEASPKGPREQTLGDHLDVDEIRVEFSKALVPTAMDPHSGLCARIGNMRRNIASDLGFVLPDVRLTDNPMLEGFRYRIRIQGARVADGEVMAGRVLVIKQSDGDLQLEGVDVAEPVYGAPARWIDDSAEDEAKILGLPVATPSEVMATHLMEAIKAHMRDLVDRPALQRLLDEFVNVSNPKKAEANRRLLNEMIPDPVPRDLLQTVIRALLDEQVSVRNLPLILESIAEARAGTDGVEAIVEAARRRLSLQITHRLLGPGDALPLIQLGPAWDDLFRQHETRDASGAIAQIALPPTEIKRLASSVGVAIQDAASRGHYPAIAVPGSRRRVVRLLLEAGGIKNPVLAFEEIGTRCRPAFVGVA
jgi:flagellar biosynthesis protein FlhA